MAVESRDSRHSTAFPEASLLSPAATLGDLWTALPTRYHYTSFMESKPGR